MNYSGCAHFIIQLFLEEERELELETLYESDIAHATNKTEVPNQGGITGGPANGSSETEVGAVTKQTTETLMAGERIMEALDIADKEREAVRDYEETLARLSETDAMRMQPPARNPILAAYDLDPEAYVLTVVAKVPSTALQDALLVLPFNKVVSLMYYLNIWAQKVPHLSSIYVQNFRVSVGIGNHTHLKNHIFPCEDTSSPDCCERRHAEHLD